MVSLSLTLNIFYTLLKVNFEQVNAGWVIATSLRVFSTLKSILLRSNHYFQYYLCI